MERRRFLKLGLLTSIALAAAGAAVTVVKPGLVDSHLAAASRAIFAAVARAVLDGSLPFDPAQRDAALSAHLDRLDNAIVAFPPATRAELSHLLTLLDTSVGRMALTGLAVPWQEANVTQLQQSLQAMRVSKLVLRQQVYQALRDLTNAAYYAAPETWQAMGYPGPRLI